MIICENKNMKLRVVNFHKMEIMFLDEDPTTLTLLANHVTFKVHNIQCSHEHGIRNISQANIEIR